jgi:hypothetical protein
MYFKFERFYICLCDLYMCMGWVEFEVYFNVTCPLRVEKSSTKGLGRVASCVPNKLGFHSTI